MESIGENYRSCPINFWQPVGRRCEVARHRFRQPIEPEWRIFCGAKPRPKWADDFVVLVDTRESSPWAFQRETENALLDCGDYSIAVVECVEQPLFEEVSIAQRPLNDIFAVERKANIEDLVNCITHERKRFEEELRKLAQKKWRAVICDFTFEMFLRRGLARVTAPAALSHSIFSWQFKYQLPFIFCPCEDIARDAFIFLAREVVKFEANR